MCGCARAAAARASRSKRWRADGIARDTWRQHLDSDTAIQPGVARLVDLAHAARAQSGSNDIRTQARAGREGSSCSRLGRRVWVSALFRSTRLEDRSRAVVRRKESIESGAQFRVVAAGAIEKD